MEYEDKTMTVTVTGHDPNLVKVKVDYDGSTQEDTKTIEAAERFMELILNLVTKKMHNKYNLKKFEIGETKTVNSSQPHQVRAACSQYGQRNNRKYTTVELTNNKVKITRIK